jgi:MerR family transcriptional regulator, light-induced transcriptional regulator
VTADTVYSLPEAAERLGVHYMTVYRYIRTGRLAARQQGSHWLISEGDLEQFGKARTAPGGRGKRSRLDSNAGERFVARLLVGDENGCWALAQEVLGGGAAPRDVYVELFAPALRLIGDLWDQGAITVADEHRASVVVQRLIGRMGPLFRPRGPHVGTVILGAPAGEMHALPTALVADILRSEGLAVIDRGADVPPDAFGACARGIDGLTGIGIGITVERHRRALGTLIRTLRDTGIAVPIVVGGAGVTEAQARSLGADHWTHQVDDLVEVLVP